jgi:hypothetical protein
MLPRDPGGLVFAEPCQAQVFALGREALRCWMVHLQGIGDWTAALENLVHAKGLPGEADLAERKEAWADAYRHAPHGKPIELPATRRQQSREWARLQRTPCASTCRVVYVEVRGVRCRSDRIFPKARWTC